MSPLATAIYNVLRSRVPNRNAQITYTHLSEVLPTPFRGVDPHLGLSAPLGEVVAWCEAKGLPPLSSIVVLANAGYPGDGYFRAAYPGVDLIAAMQRWATDFELAKATKYPAVL